MHESASCNFSRRHSLQHFVPDLTYVAEHCQAGKVAMRPDFLVSYLYMLRPLQQALACEACRLVQGVTSLRMAAWVKSSALFINSVIGSWNTKGRVIETTLALPKASLMIFQRFAGGIGSVSCGSAVRSDCRLKACSVSCQSSSGLLCTELPEPLSIPSSAISACCQQFCLLTRTPAQPQMSPCPTVLGEPRCPECSNCLTVSGESSSYGCKVGEYLRKAASGFSQMARSLTRAKCLLL